MSFAGVNSELCSYGCYFVSVMVENTVEKQKITGE